MYKVLLLISIVLATAPAYAAQLDVDIRGEQIEPEFRFLRVVTIEHSEGGELAELFSQADSEISFQIDSQNSDSSIVKLLEDHIKRELSTSSVDSVVLEYKVILSHQPHSTTIEYKIDMIPSLSSTATSSFVDFQWRGFNITEPVMVQTVHGLYDVNDPSSAIQILAPTAHQKLMETNAREILSLPLLDASGLQTPLISWHFLFDPIGKLIDDIEIDTVVSQYSLGECRITDGQVCKDKSWTSEIELDKKYSIRATESKDDATVTLLGYTKISSVRGIEYFERIEEALPEPTEDLSVSMMYGMAGIAAIAGGIFFVFSSRKTKHEQGMGQTGIDPSNLISYATSKNSGGYHTNRGESVLRIDDKKSAI